MQRVGSRAQVMHGNAKMTGGGLRKKDLKYNKQGKIVSKKMSKLAKKEKRLQKAGYTTRKGQFGAVRIMKGGANGNPNAAIPGIVTWGIPRYQGSSRKREVPDVSLFRVTGIQTEFGGRWDAVIYALREKIDDRSGEREFERDNVRDYYIGQLLKLPNNSSNKQYRVIEIILNSPNNGSGSGKIKVKEETERVKERIDKENRVIVVAEDTGYRMPVAGDMWYMRDLLNPNQQKEGYKVKKRLLSQELSNLNHDLKHKIIQIKTDHNIKMQKESPGTYHSPLVVYEIIPKDQEL